MAYVYIVNSAFIAGVKVCLTIDVVSLSIGGSGFLSGATQPNDVHFRSRLIAAQQKKISTKRAAWKLRLLPARLIRMDSDWHTASKLRQLAEYALQPGRFNVSL